MTNTSESPSVNQGTPAQQNNRNRSVIFVVLLVVVTGLSLLLIEGFIMKSVNESREYRAAATETVDKFESRWAEAFGPDVYPKMFANDPYYAKTGDLYDFRDTLISDSNLPVVVAAPLSRGYTLEIVYQDGTRRAATADECVAALRRAQAGAKDPIRFCTYVPPGRTKPFGPSISYLEFPRKAFILLP